MKLAIQILCYNEEHTLPIVLSSLPKKLDGIDKIEILVIDDGSTDKTVEVAKSLGVNNIVRHSVNKGLVKAFSTGILTSLKMDADIMVNIDGDNQYCADDIGKLIKPILQQKADFVIGIRPIRKMRDFSFIKKKFQVLGSFVVSKIAGIDIPDVTSGFRAISRDAAMKLNLFSLYTYTLETIIQAQEKDIVTSCVPVRVNPKTRESRLMKNMWDYIIRSVISIFRLFLYYRPVKFFLVLGITIFGFGFILGLRFMYYYLNSQGRGHIQSLILSAILSIIGFNIFTIGFVASLINLNRKMLENLSYWLKKVAHL